MESASVRRGSVDGGFATFTWCVICVCRGQILLYPLVVAASTEALGTSSQPMQAIFQPFRPKEGSSHLAVISFQCLNIICFQLTHDCCDVLPTRSLTAACSPTHHTAIPFHFIHMIPHQRELHVCRTADYFYMLCAALHCRPVRLSPCFAAQATRMFHPIRDQNGPLCISIHWSQVRRVAS